MYSCAPIDNTTKENLEKLRSLFDGKRTVDVDGKPQYIGDKISKHYSTTKDAFGRKMFEEIVWRSTYKPAVDSFDGFTPGDFRRIKNEIIKESKRLNNPRLGVLERLFGVKRGVMNKFAVTGWMNKHFNIATNYERTQFNNYIESNIAISRLLRTEIVKRGGQGKFRPGIKTSKQLEKFERDLALELQNPVSQASIDRVNRIRDEMLELMKTEGGIVLEEFREYMETTPTVVGKEKIAEDKAGNPIYRDKTRVLKSVTDEVGNERLEPFSNNVELAGKLARDTLDRMGKVMVSGLNQHKKVVRLAFLNTLSNSALTGEVGKRVRSYEEKINEEIKAIEKGIKGGDYFPHYLLETFIKIENILQQDRAKLLRDPEGNLSELENIFSNMRKNLGTPASAHHRKSEPFTNYMKNPLGVIRKYSMDAIAFNRVNYLRQIYLQGIQRKTLLFFKNLKRKKKDEN